MEPEKQAGENNNLNVEDSKVEQPLAVPVVEENSDSATAKDTSSHKTIATIGYILPFLFFLPLIDDEAKKDEYARFHANQQLILLILVVGLQFVHSMLLVSLMALGYFLMNILNIAILVLAIIGAIGAYKGKMKELPLVGNFRILK